MFEDGVGGIAVGKILGDAAVDCDQFRGVVIGFAQAQVDEIGGDDMGRFEALVFRQAKLWARRMA